MIRETVGHLRDLPRYRQILSSLVRYGYQDVVAALHLEGIVRPFERVMRLGSEVPPQDRPRRLRLVCEDLGPTFVKLGQLLSTRPDLLPESYTSELAALRDDVRPFPFAQVETILREEYGRALSRNCSPPSRRKEAQKRWPPASISPSPSRGRSGTGGSVMRFEGATALTSPRL